MGAWGTGPFENDDALDFAGTIKCVDDLERVLEEVVDDTVMPADLASRVIVVAECVAAMHGQRNAEMPDDLANIVHSFGKPSIELFEQSREQLAHVISMSELAELWAKSDDRSGWNRAAHDLIERLNKPVRKAIKPRKKKLDPNPSPCMMCAEPMGEEEFSMFDITLDSGYGPFRQGGWVHFACLNAALHPRHMIQNWQFDDEMLDRIQGKLQD